MIDLDYTANTPVDERVLARFCETERLCIGNANSRHAAGRQAAEILHASLQHMAQMLGAKETEIIQTSGASESNNTAIKGILRASRHVGRHVITTPLEHASVSGCLTAMQEQGAQIDVVSIDRQGRVNLEELAELLRRDTVLVTISAVDSELGVVQPVREIARMLEAISFQYADTMSLAAHKFYGLNGVGLLLRREDVGMEPLIHGGVSASLYRSGTPPVGLAAATETALEIALSEQAARYERVQKLNARLRAALAVYPKVAINSPEHAIPHILNLSVEGVRGAAMAAALDARGVCVSVKSACSVEGTPSRAVFAVSRNRQRAMNSIRISLSHLTTDEEISEFLDIFKTCYEEMTK